MKIRLRQHLTSSVIPDGEGFTALPIAFINVIARRSANDDEAISLDVGGLLRRAEAASRKDSR